MSIRVINVSGRLQKTDTKQDSCIKILPAKHVDLDSHMDIGVTMMNQIKQGLLKIRPVPVEPDYPKSHPAGGYQNLMSGPVPVEVEDAKPEKVEDVKAEKTVVIPPADLKVLAESDVSNDDFIKAVIRKMIADGNNLGLDGKPNQPVLETRVKELRPNIQHVKASRRDRLLEDVVKEDNSD